jgi:PhnB protein
MAADIPVPTDAQRLPVTRLRLGVDSDAEAERIFSALSEGGEVFMPMQEITATRFGQLRDQFGINWMIIQSGR